MKYTDLPEQTKAINPLVVKENLHGRLSGGPIVHEKPQGAMGTIGATVKKEDFVT